MQIMGKNIYLWPFKFCIFCIFALHVSWARPFVASQSDHYRRLFSGTLGMLPVVLPNQHLPVTIVHFLWYSPLCWLLILDTNNKHVETTPSSGVQCPHTWALSPLCCYSLPLHIQSHKLQPNEVTMGPSGHMSAPGHASGNISITRDTVH